MTGWLIYLLSRWAMMDQTMSSGCMYVKADVPTTSVGISPVTNDILEEKITHYDVHAPQKAINGIFF